jgi:flagellar biosynthetic protein FliR
VTEAYVIAFTLLLARVATFVAVQPVFGGRSTPRLVKVGLAVALTVMWFGSVGPGPAQGLLASTCPAPVFCYVVALVREAVLGALFSYALGLLLLPARIAGEFIEQELGLAIGRQFNPLLENPSAVVSQIFETLGILIFLSLDGHHVFLATLHHTFDRYPIGVTAFEAVPIGPLVAGGSRAQEWGLVVAAPVSALLLIVAVVLGLMARTSPQLNIFTVGFPLRVGVGLAGMWLLVPDLLTAVAGFMVRVGDLVPRLLG